MQDELLAVRAAKDKLLRERDEALIKNQQINMDFAVGVIWLQNSLRLLTARSTTTERGDADHRATAKAAG